MLTLRNSQIPSRLLRLAQPPAQLYVDGELAPLLGRPCVGIVGSRKVSAYGRAVTERFARELAAQGIVIVSGLALGVDSIAHQAALDAGGLTIAVLPSSVNEVYPSSHRVLAKQIVNREGALVSEYVDGTPAFKENFIARNRIIAGLSNALVVTEAALKSGSLHTARFALEQGKDVLAVPGPITSETSVGTNNLIKAGATPITEVADIFYAMKLQPTALQKPRVRGDTPEEQIILDLITGGLNDGVALAVQSELDARIFNQSLTMLEIAGKIRSGGANTWTL